MIHFTEHIYMNTLNVNKGKTFRNHGTIMERPLTSDLQPRSGCGVTEVSNKVRNKENFLHYSRGSSPESCGAPQWTAQEVLSELSGLHLHTN